MRRLSRLAAPLLAGCDDLLATSQQLAPGILQRHGYEPKLIQSVLKFSDSLPMMALSLKTDEALRQRIQQAWEDMRKDGSVAVIGALSGRYLRVGDVPQG